MRRICYISGTRADFGLMRSTLQILRDHVEVDLAVIATGMHLSPWYGNTVEEIEAAGLRIAARVPVPLEPATGATMARNIGTMVSAFVDTLESERPDAVLLLGDRGEMLAGALAGIHLNIPVAHIHGGERSGTVDEPVRHAISKLSHLHFAATDEARERLVRMGEDPDRIHVTGAPGLDGLMDGELPDRDEVLRLHGLDPARPFALMVYHPVLQEAETAADDTRRILKSLADAGLQTLALMPNADAGSEGVREALGEAKGQPGLTVRTHLARPAFIAAMAHADLMIGNSSAGIIEAASFGTPVLNVGPRQNLRERNANVLDVPATEAALADGVARLLAQGRLAPHNVYGDGRAGERIARLLATTPLDGTLMMKVNGY
ncbi:UDP-N-acetylglucosamine 2-epimerase [Brevundimonas lenta]|uniref:GDP/UDP-N,N'-diacetylbacillosamine 2-epimerase (Hydrolyzing) n=1 Tax=Brevundimonas lenta TaxID=424796 RepID=A0A7W6JH87_9CAUL|nr:UDP-N-acetylglucosamine 2-epimerase [Brevundimonas lenta]MBB4084133.1 GDP/UDP-N,N'-diacetylbacillosamine 2-epimerase (hydrolyzing) [Brevundimonas lenta]